MYRDLDRTKPVTSSPPGATATEGITHRRHQSAPITLASCLSVECCCCIIAKSRYSALLLRIDCLAFLGQQLFSYLALRLLRQLVPSLPGINPLSINLADNWEHVS